MSKRRLSDETFVELTTAASKALLEKGHSGQQLRDWVLDIVELQQERTTLRDEFAAKAMQGMWASDTETWRCNFTQEGLENRARYSYKMADAMLKARKEPEK